MASSSNSNNSDLNNNHQKLSSFNPDQNAFIDNIIRPATTMAVQGRNRK